MAANEDEFLKKVYDKYLNIDYSYGVSNLNPKREINKQNLDDAKDVEDKIVEEIEKQFAAIKASTKRIIKAKKPVDEDEDDFTTDSGNMGGAGGPKESETEQDLYDSLGGDSLFYVPGEDADEGPLEREIKAYILKLTPFLPGTSISKDKKTGKTKITIDPEKSGLEGFNGAVMLKMSCGEDEVDSSLTFDEDEKAAWDGDANPPHGQPGHCCGSDCPENPVHGEEGHVCDKDCPGYESDDDDDDTSGDGSNGNDSDSDNDEDSDDDATVVECAVQQCALLKIILMIVKIIAQLKKILAMVLSIVVPIIKIVARAASCWVDPPAAAEAVQLVVEKVAAIIIGLIGKILQMIWDALQLDCLNSMIQSILDQINQALAAIDDLKQMGEEMSFMTGAAINEAKTAKENVEKLKKRKEEAEKAAKEKKKFFDGCGKAASDAFTGADWGSVIPPGALKMYKLAKEMKKKTKELGKSIDKKALSEAGSAMTNAFSLV